MFRFLLACTGALAAAACSGNAEPAHTGSSSAAVTSSDAPVSALTGTWVFALDESEVATKVRSDCEGRSNGDASKAAACYAEVKAEGSTEKLRFTSQAGGKTLWTSFGQHDSGEELFLEAPLILAAEGPNRYVGTVAGELRGKQAEAIKKDAPDGHGIPFELVDARTLAMPDPHKGRLVFHKEP